MALVVSSYHVTSVKTKTHAADRTCHLGRHRVLGNPVLSVPDEDERVAGACREVGTGGRHGDTVARRGVAVQGMEVGKGGIVNNIDGTSTCRNKELETRIGKGERRRLEGLGILSQLRERR